MKGPSRSRPILVFGGGVIAEVAIEELRQGGYENLTVCVDKGYAASSRIQGLPIIEWDDIANQASPLTHAAFVAVGYQNLNRFRKHKLSALQSLGYSIISVTPDEKCSVENALVAKEAIVQVGARIGSNSFVWGGATVGHHTEIGENCWISSGATIAGNCHVGDFSFLGVGAIVTHEVNIGADCIIGAGAIVTRDLPAGTVVVSKPSTISKMNSTDFLTLFPI
jgi:sugar O-acyltransferase (sialic acid O-acetyltransferase NeuD family)